MDQRQREEMINKFTYTKTKPDFYLTVYTVKWISDLGLTYFLVNTGSESLHWVAQDLTASRVCVFTASQLAAALTSCPPPPGYFPTVPSEVSVTQAQVTDFIRTRMREPGLVYLPVVPSSLPTQLAEHNRDTTDAIIGALSLSACLVNPVPASHEPAVSAYARQPRRIDRGMAMTHD